MKYTPKILSLLLLLSITPMIIFAGKNKKRKNIITQQPAQTLVIPQPTIQQPLSQERTYAQVVAGEQSLSESVVFVNSLEHGDADLTEKIKAMQLIQKQLKALEEQREKMKQEGRATIEQLQEKLVVADKKIEQKEQTLKTIEAQRKTLAEEISQALLAKDTQKKQSLEQQLLTLNTQEEKLNTSLTKLRSTKEKIEQKIQRVGSKPKDSLVAISQPVSITQESTSQQIAEESKPQDQQVTQQNDQQTSRSWLNIFTLGLFGKTQQQ